MKRIRLLMMIPSLLLAGCGGGDEDTSSAAADHASAAKTAPPPAAQPASAGWHGKVAETMNAGGYTYVRIDTDDGSHWLAGPETEVAVGEAVSADRGMEMRDFHSSKLDRTFASVWFVGGIATDDAPADAGASSPHGGMMGAMGGADQHKNVADQGVTGVAKADGGVTVAEVHAQAAELAGRTVRVRGRVVKFSPNIMGTNWVHIQDGSGGVGSHDLTVTTDARVQVGDLVLVEGALAVDKDFGAGYRYDVIVEQARVRAE